MVHAVENAPVWHCLWSYFLYPCLSPLLLSCLPPHCIPLLRATTSCWCGFLSYAYTAQVDLLFDGGLFGPFWETATFVMLTFFGGTVSSIV
jgi:hypothetical protein